MPAREDPADAPTPPFVPWARFLPTFLREWGPNDGVQDRHVSVVGHNGSGKTTLVYAILDARVATFDTCVLSFVTKARDVGITRIARKGNPSGWVIRRAMANATKGKEQIGGYGEDRILFWPEYGEPQTAAARQARVIRPALQTAFKEGRRIVHFNETFTLIEMGFSATLKAFWREGRANDLIVVAETQRPQSRELPREMWTEARHLFAFKITDLRDMEVLGMIGSGRVSTKVIAAHMAALGEHEALYVNLRTGAMIRTKVAT